MGQLLKLPVMVPGDLEAQGDGGYSKCSRVLFRQLWVSFWVPFARDSGPSRQQRPDKQSTSRSSLEIVVIFLERRTDRKPGLLVGDLWADRGGLLPRAIVSAGGRQWFALTTLGSCWCFAPRQRLLGACLLVVSQAVTRLGPAMARSIRTARVVTRGIEGE